METDQALSDLGTYDYVVVGAGSAGCVLANRLSADPGNRVLLIEAGGSDRRFWVNVPIGYLYCMGNPATDWCFKTESEPGLNGRALNYPRGKVLGGCSSINGMIYMRGQARDYDAWRQLGNAGWAWDDVLPYFKKSERHFGGETELHGGSGEIHVQKPRLSWQILDAVEEAAAEIGIPPTDDFNSGHNEGAGYFQVMQNRGVRWNSRKAFIDPASRRPNLRVLTDAHVERLTLDDGRCATGLVLRHHGQPCRVRAEGEVILAAGAIGSPQILQVSGIGPGDLLAGLGIPVARDHPGVGDNLQDHLQIRTVFKITGAETLNDRAGSLFGKLAIAAEYALNRSGPMSMAPSQFGIFTRSDPAQETADLEFHVQPLSLESFGQPLHDFPALTVSVCNLRPQSRGTCHITTADPYTPPAIRPNYLSAEHDRRVAAESIRAARRLMATKRMAEFRPDEFLPGPQYTDDGELAKVAGDIATTIFHPVGTARMGNDDRAVVDDRLRVRGVDGLRVVDASIMPTITSGNTHAPVTMIAEKASEMILADR